MQHTYNDRILNYEVIGEGQPVLLIHGLACDMNLMKGCMEPVFSNINGYKRIYIDLPGMGKSTGGLDYASSDSILDILIDFVDKNIHENFIIVGESYGGYLTLGLMLSLKHKVMKTVLVCPMVEPENIKRILPQKDVTYFDHSFLETLCAEEKDSFCEYAVVANKETYTRFENEVLVGLKVADSNYIGKLLEEYPYSFSLKEKLTEADLQIPTLVLAGKQDICVGYEDLYSMSKYLPRSSFILIDKAGHNLQIDQADLFQSIVTNWLSD